MADIPTKYDDPYWTGLAASTESKLNIPKGLLQSILVHGEKSNADQVSSAGAKTPFQIIPQTRKAVLDKYGIDAYISPENAAEAAGLLLQESLKRNNNDPSLAAAEYHGGTNPKNWGPINKAYVKRVMSGLNTEPKEQKPKKMSIKDTYKAYQSGELSPEETQEFETQVKEKRLMLPEGAFLKGSEPSKEPKKLNEGAIRAYNEGRMPSKVMDDLDTYMTNGTFVLPEGMQLVRPPEPETDVAGLMGAFNRGVSPYAAGAAVGAAVGAPFAGVGAVPGAVAGVTAMGLAKILGDPGVRLVNSVLGTDYTEPTEAFENLLTRVGVAEPDSQAEKIIQTTADATAGGLGFVRAGQQMVANAPKNTLAAGVGKELADQPAKQVLSAAGAGAGAETANQMDAPVPVQLAAGLAGSVAPYAVGRRPPVTQAVDGGAPVVDAPVQAVPEPPMTTEQLTGLSKTASQGGMGSKKATQQLAEQALPDQRVLQSAENLGIKEFLQPDHVTTSQSYRELAQATKSIPGSAGREKELRGFEEIGRRAQRLISELGGDTDLANLNQDVRNKLRNTIDDLSDAANKAYDDIAEKIPAKTKTQPTNILTELRKTADEIGGVENMMPEERAILKKLSPKKVKTADGTKTIEPTYALLDQVRKDIGGATKGKGAFKDSDTGRAKFLYSKISEDQKAVADQFGLTDDWKIANNLVRVRKGVEDDMSSLFGKQLNQSFIPKLSTATTSLSKGDADKMVNLLKSVPSDMRESVTVSALNTAFGKATRDGQLNFNTFTKWYEGLLKNKNAYTALMSNLPRGSRRQIQELYRVSKNINLARGERITTGRIQAIKQDFQAADGIIGNVYGVAKRAAFAVPIEAATTAAGFPGAGLASGLTSALQSGKKDIMKAADELISSPEFQALAIEATKTAGKPQPSVVQRLAKSVSFKKFANKLGLPPEPAVRNAFIYNNLVQKDAE